MFIWIQQTRIRLSISKKQIMPSWKSLWFLATRNSVNVSSCSPVKDMTIQINRIMSVVHQEQQILLCFYFEVIWRYDIWTSFLRLWNRLGKHWLLSLGKVGRQRELQLTFPLFSCYWLFKTRILTTSPKSLNTDLAYKCLLLRMLINSKVYMQTKYMQQSICRRTGICPFREWTNASAVPKDGAEQKFCRSTHHVHTHIVFT